MMLGMKLDPGRSLLALAALALAPILALSPVSAQAQSDGLLGGNVKKGTVAGNEVQAKISRLETQVAASPDNYRLQYQLGNAYYDGGLSNKALAAYQKAVDLNPKYVEALVNLGIVQGDLGDQDNAIKSFQQALSLNPDDCMARSNLGNAYYAQEKYPDAIFEYQRAIDKDPKCYSALYNFGVAFADAGLFREAVNWWQKVVEVAPGTDAAENAKENIKILERFTKSPVPSIPTGKSGK